MPRLFATAWLRPALALAALAGLLSLTGCGGGSGAVQAPGNVVTPPSAVTVLPQTQTIYPGTPASFTISGGVPPYQVFSSNSAVLPVAQAVAGSTVVLLANPVSTTTAVTITVQDSAAQTTPANIQVAPAVLFPNGVTIAASQGTCGSGAICTGETGTARVQGTGIAGAALAGRQIRFDVVYGAFGIQSTNPAAPLVQTLTVTTDSAGVAQVGIQALVDVTTQPAQIRATDVATGQALIGNFTIVRNQDGSQFITVIPDTATITSPTTDCSAGAVVDYRIYGGTPPYRVTSSFPGAVSILNSTVAASGGFFEVRTNGTCVDPLTFSILDSAGKQTTATLTNSPGSSSGGGGGGTSAMVVTPTTLGDNTTSCAGTFTVNVSGGTPPYNISQTSSTTSPYALANFPSTLAAAGTVSFSGLTGPTGTPVTYTFLVTDSAFSPTTQQQVSITCLP